MKTQQQAAPKRGATTTFGNVVIGLRESSTSDVDYEILIGIRRLSNTPSITSDTFHRDDLDDLYTAVSWAIWLAEHWATDYSKLLDEIKDKAH